MPTVPECLQNAHHLIQQSAELLISHRRHAAEIQAQLEASRKTISESLDVLRAATSGRAKLNNPSLMNQEYSE